jgi:uncharacterized protein YbjT (DUF2867 family)
VDELKSRHDIAPVLFQPIAAEDVAKAVGRVAVSAPVNGIVEIAGPQQFRFDEFIRLGLGARQDPRVVIADPHARYYGTELGERTLVPGGTPGWARAASRTGSLSPPSTPCRAKVQPRESVETERDSMSRA